MPWQLREDRLVCDGCGAVYPPISTKTGLLSFLLAEHLRNDPSLVHHDCNAERPAIPTSQPGSLGYHASYWRQFAAPKSGPGDCLHEAILKWVAQAPTKGCGCEDRIAKMNALGPVGCQAMIDDIVGWLTEEAKKRGWWKYAVAVPGASYFIRKLITDAIDESERLYKESRPPLFHAFYHVACMGNWREVFQEQADLFASVGILPTACVLGREADAAHVATRMHVHSRYDGLNQFETPTLQALWQWCQENPTGIALYAHTKGVSQPHDARRVAWRQLMGEYVIRDWRENVRKLDAVDAVGVDWLDRPPYAHFAGNFWMARADWINRLPSPWQHRINEIRPGDKWWGRLHAELWISCRPDICIESLCCRNAWIWGGRQLHRLLAIKRNQRLADEGQPVPTGPVPQVRVVRHEAFLRHLRLPGTALLRRA